MTTTTLAEELVPTLWTDRERDERANLDRLSSRLVGAKTLTPTERADAIADRLRRSASLHSKFGKAHHDPKRIEKVIAAQQAARLDRIERRAMKEANEKPRRSPPTRLTSQQERDEAKAYREWERPELGVRGGLLLAGYLP